MPSNGLFIEGGPTSSAGAGNAGAIAYAALTYDLPAGATVGKLTLTVAPNSATTPSTTLELCALTIQSFQSEEGGPMSDAPSYNCTNNVTAAQASNAYQFNVSPLVSSGALSFAILPTSPTDRVVLAQPDAQSLPVQASSDTTVASPIDTGSSSGTFGSTAGTDTGSSTGAGSAPVDTSGATPVPTGVAATPVPSAPLSPSLAQPRTTTNPSTPSANAALVSPATSSAGPKPWVGVIFLVVLLLAAALWMGAGRSASAEQPAASD